MRSLKFILSCCPAGIKNLNLMLIDEKIEGGFYDV